MLRIALLLIFTCFCASAQIHLPNTLSPRATISQRVSVTDLSIDYGRPSVRDRKVFHDVVPMGQLWRAGADENTVFTCSTPVSINGQALPAGRYGLHMIPNERQWTLVFSKDADAWGSYFYNKANDAARVTVSPAVSEHTELLTYDVPDVSASSATIRLRWATVAVSFTVSVDNVATVEASLRKQLSGLAGFSSDSWVQACQWLIRNKASKASIAEFADFVSTRFNPTFSTMTLKAEIAGMEGNVEQANNLRVKACEMGTNAEINSYGYTLLQSGNASGAVAVFTVNAKRYPEDPNTWDSLGEALATAGDIAAAKVNFSKALSMNPSPEVRANSEMWLKKLESQ